MAEGEITQTMNIKQANIASVVSWNLFTSLKFMLDQQTYIYYLYIINRIFILINTHGIYLQCDKSDLF